MTWTRFVKWLYPGMRVKRWLFLAVFGIIAIGAGLTVILQNEVIGTLERWIRDVALDLTGRQAGEPAIVVGIVLLLVGGVAVWLGFRQIIRSVVTVFLPGQVDRLADIVYEKRHLKRGPKIVVVGGGTGLATLLRGLKVYTSNLTAVVTVADDGGSSGRLRAEMGILPPGDIRNTLVALAETEPLMEALFQYRFKAGEGLAGHSFGNLFIAAMTGIVGDFEEAIRELSKVLAIRGQVLPSTLEQVILRAEFADGSVAEGESAIPALGKKIEKLSLRPQAPPAVTEALDAFAEADAIILGPGSLFTSLIPNLLVDGIVEAIRKSQAAKIYVCNVMTQPGETDGYCASDHVKALYNHVGEGWLNYVIVNDEEISDDKADKYLKLGAEPVLADIEALADLGVTPLPFPLVDQTDLVRHQPQALAEVIMELIIRLKAHKIQGKMRRKNFRGGGKDDIFSRYEK